MDDREISEILNTIRAKADRQQGVARTQLSEKDPKLVDIDEFIDVLYSLLKDGKYIADKQDDSTDVNKFVFTEEYPSFTVGQTRIVTAEVNRRELASLASSAEPFAGTHRYRPMIIGEDNDTKDGSIDIHMQTMYDNQMILTCWSPSLRDARKLASLLETFLQKYYWVLRRSVPVCLYTGRREMIVDDRFGDSRYFGIPLSFFVRTNEKFTIKESELRNIRIKHDIG